MHRLLVPQNNIRIFLKTCIGISNLLNVICVVLYTDCGFQYFKPSQSEAVFDYLWVRVLILNHKPNEAPQTFG